MKEFWVIRSKSRVKSRTKMYTAASGFLSMCFVCVFVVKPNSALFMFVHREEKQVKICTVFLGRNTAGNWWIKIILVWRKTKGRKQVWSRFSNFNECEMKLLVKDNKENNENQTKPNLTKESEVSKLRKQQKRPEKRREVYLL